MKKPRGNPNFNKDQSSADASKNARKARSPWRRGPMVKKQQNHDRFKGWQDEL